MSRTGVPTFQKIRKRPPRYSSRSQGRGWVPYCRRLSATSVVALSFFGLLPVAASSASLSHLASSASRSTTHAQFPWKGRSAPCAVRLPLYGSIRYESFNTCPPKHVLLIGDSVALTMGIQLSLNEQNWGTLVQNAGLSECGYLTGYNVEDLGTVTALNPKCAQERLVWVKDARAFKPQAIVVEMGWWDSFQHLIDGGVSSLGQPQYDSMVQQQIVGLISSLRSASSAPIYFLSVPWMDPGPLSNGQREPAASAASHEEINILIKAATQASKTVHFVDVSRYITPAGHYESTVDGGRCRATDGVGLYDSSPGTLRYVQTQCGKALQRGILATIRQDLAVHAHR